MLLKPSRQFLRCPRYSACPLFLILVLVLFISPPSLAATWICSDQQGNKVYTDHNGPGCREFQTRGAYNNQKNTSAGAAQAEQPRQKGGSLTRKDSGPRSRSVTESRSDPSKVLQNKGVKYSEEDLLGSVASGDKAKVELCLRAGINPNTKDDQGQPVLMLASALGNKEIAETLIAHGADVNFKTKQGATPLLASIIMGQKDISKLLIEK